MENREINNLLCNLKVLYVEDEDFTRDELSKFLKRRVGKLYLAKNGIEGIDAIKHHNPDIVIIDIKMPIMDGLEMARSIRQMGYDCSIIIISALSDSDTILKAVDIGIVKYVVKPVNTNELISTMEKLALDILKNKLNQTIIKNSFLVNKEQKQELEKKIKSDMAHFLKTYTGKGPRDVQAFIKGNVVEIKAFEVLTLLELSLISNGQNNKLVDYSRRLLYSEKKAVLEQMIGKIINSKAKVENIQCDSSNNTDIITFSF